MITNWAILSDLFFGNKRIIPMCDMNFNSNIYQNNRKQHDKKLSLLKYFIIWKVDTIKIEWHEKILDEKKSHTFELISSCNTSNIVENSTLKLCQFEELTSCDLHCNAKKEINCHLQLSINALSPNKIAGSKNGKKQRRCKINKCTQLQMTIFFSIHSFHYLCAM